MAGVPQRSIMELLGHRDPRMTVRYQHLAPGHLREAMRALEQAATALPAPATGAARADAR
jgi:integrase